MRYVSVGSTGDLVAGPRIHRVVNEALRFLGRLRKSALSLTLVDARGSVTSSDSALRNSEPRPGERRPRSFSNLC